MPPAITFDFWNTLVTEPAGHITGRRRRAVVAALAEHEITLDDLTLDGHLRSAGSLQEVAWERGEQFLPAQAAHALGELVAAGHDDARAAVVAAYLGAGDGADLSLTPGVGDLLPRLAAAGIPLGIVCDVGITGSQYLRGFLERAGVLQHFTGWAFSDEAGAFKPSPVIFEHVRRELGIDSLEGCVHVGDLRRTDVAGARAAGMTTVRYRRTNDDTSDFPDADHVIDNWSEFSAVLGLALPA